MGWLRDLMAACEPEISSYNALARQVLASPHWGDASRPQSRSLGALFSKLDRKVELEWLADRPSVQVALADVLQCPLHEIRSVLDGRPLTETGHGRLRLTDVRYARPVDLATEPPCPGIPSRVLNPRLWTKLWWVAPTGSGKTLAGQWLQARGLARHLEGRHWDDVVGLVSPHLPTLVELSSASLVERPAGPICIAAPAAPLNPSGWEIVESPPVATFIEELVHWVASRLPDGGQFDADLALQWFHQGPLETGLVDSLGCALGWCGVLDEEGVRPHRRASGGTAKELASKAFERRVAELARHDAPDAAWLRKNGFEVLVGLARRLLTDATDSWSAPRSLDAWMELVPTEHQRDVDLDWLRTTLSDDPGRIREADLERAARRLPPGAYRIVRGLRAGRWLEETSPGTFALRPLWLARVVLAAAEHQLVHGSPFEYGEALLASHAAERIARGIHHRVLREECAPLDEVTELEADDNPAFVAALEMVVRAAGCALLAGHDLNPEALEALWFDQTRLLVRLPNEPPRPRVGHRALPGSLLHDTTWRLAALAITERLESPSSDPCLDPWKRSALSAELLLLLDTLSDQIGTFAPAFAHQAYALVDRLHQALGHLTDPPHPLEEPAALLDAVELGVLSWDLLGNTCRTPHAASALVELVRRRGRDWAEVARELWRVWAESGTPLSALPWLADSSSTNPAWPHLSPELIEADVVRRLDPLDATHWSNAQLTRLSEHLGALTKPGEIALCRTAPSEWLENALERWTPTEVTAARIVWQRCEAGSLAALARVLESGPRSALAALLSATPDGLTSVAVERLASVPRDGIPDANLDCLRDWLHSSVARRVPRFTVAFAMLTDIERELWHAAGHRA